MSEWNSTRLKRILVDYMLRMSYYDTAVKLAERSNIQDLIDIDVFLEAKKVIDALQKKEVGPALAWCGDNKSRLKKSKLLQLAWHFGMKNIAFRKEEITASQRQYIPRETHIPREMVGICGRGEKRGGGLVLRVWLCESCSSEFAVCVQPFIRLVWAVF